MTDEDWAVHCVELYCSGQRDAAVSAYLSNVSLEGRARHAEALEIALGLADRLGGLRELLEMMHKRYAIDNWPEGHPKRTMEYVLDLPMDQLQKVYRHLPDPTVPDPGRPKG